MVKIEWIKVENILILKYYLKFEEIFVFRIIFFGKFGSNEIEEESDGEKNKPIEKCSRRKKIFGDGVCHVAILWDPHLSFNEIKIHLQ